MICSVCDTEVAEVRWRGRCVSCDYDLKAAARRDRRTKTNAVDREAVPRLDSEPIRNWLSQHMGGYTKQAMGLRCGVNDRVIGKILNEQNYRPSLDTVDKILVAFACSPTVLPELYPDLYVA